MASDLFYIDEPPLEFGKDRHPDIRYGILNFGPFDLRDSNSRRPTSITTSLVGTPTSIAVAARWIDSCRSSIQRHPSKKINLFTHFPGFSPDGPFACDCVLADSLNATVTPKEITALKSVGEYNERVRQAVELFMQALTHASQKRPDVLILALPTELLGILGEEDAEDEDERSATETPSRRDRQKLSRGRWNFHDMIKARSLRGGIPVQLLRPSTCDPKLKRQEKDGYGKGRRRQDDATCAWNFFVALYYKAGGYPWRLVRDQADYTTCFIGISFFEALDRSRLRTSLAQVFDERGHGMIVQGGLVAIDEKDRQPHMDADAAYALIKNAIENYRREHHTSPARVVVHKSSSFNEAEKDGTKKALGEFQIDNVDLLNLDTSFTRLARNGYYPPLRGTGWLMDDERTLLYTNGTVQLYEEYPGLYVPRTLLIHHDDCVSDRLELAKEILALTKMNWNNSQITALHPITLRASRQVGRIIKYVKELDSQANYRFFM